MSKPEIGPTREFFKQAGHSAYRLTLILIAVCMVSSCDFGGAEQTDSPLSEHRGKWVILNYWATWCAPCIKEIPELNSLASSGDFVVLGFNYDEKTGPALAKDISKMGIEFETLEQNPADALSLSRPEGLPVTYLFNEEGQLAAKLVGPQTEDELRERINQLKTES